MLEKLVDIVDYTGWFSDNSTKVPSRSPVEKVSYVEMVKSNNSNKTGGKKEPSQTFNYQGKFNDFGRRPSLIQKH